MEVWLSETYYNDGDSSSEILLHLPNTDYWFGIHLYEDYDSLTSIDFTPIFWEAVKKQDKELLTKLGPF